MPACLCSAIRRGLAEQNPSPLTCHSGVTSLAAIIKKLGEFRKLAAARAATPRCAIDGQAQKLRKSLLPKGTLGRLTSYYVGGRTCARLAVRSEEHTSELQSLRHLVC